MREYHTISNRTPMDIRNLIDGLTAETDELTAFGMAANGGRTDISYGQVRDLVRQLAAALIEMGIHKNHKVGVYAENRLEWPIAYLAIMYAGAIVVPLDIKLGPDDLLAAVRYSGMKAVFTSETLFTGIQKAGKKARKLEAIILMDYLSATESGPGSPALKVDAVARKIGIKPEWRQGKRRCGVRKMSIGSYTEMISEAKRQMRGRGARIIAQRKVNPDDIAAMIPMHDDVFVMLRHKALLSNAHAAAGHFHPDRQYAEPGDICIAALPFNHTFPAMFQILIPILCRATVEILRTKSPAEMLQAIADSGARHFTTVPLILRRLLTEIRHRRYRLKTLKFIAVGGAPIHKQTLLDFEALGIQVLQGYGLSEFSPVVSFNRPDANKPGSVGLPLEGVTVMIDPVDSGGSGELMVRGPGIMSGYYKKTKETRKAFAPDGWLRTGDLAEIDDDGFLYIIGRRKHLIVNMGGKNIYPSEIEKRLLNSSYIAAARVFPKLDSVTGESPQAVIYPNIYRIARTKQEADGMAPDIRAIIRSEIDTHTRGIARYKYLRTFQLTYDKKDARLTNREPLCFKGLYIGEGAEAQAESVEGPIREHDRGNAVETFQDDLCLLIRALFELESAATHPDAYLISLNLDSVAITTLTEEINQRYSLDITPAWFFEIPSSTIRGFSIRLYNRYRKEIDTFYTLQSSDASIKEPQTPFSQPLAEPGRAAPAHAGRCAEGFCGKMTSPKDIAVVGMSGVLPKSADLRIFEKHLNSEADLVRPVPSDRWAAASPDGLKNIQQWGGFIDGVDLFDPMFFGISPLETETMDVQQRLFLETAWHVIEDAGYKASDFSGTRTGVFVGASTHDYADIVKRSPSASVSHAATGSVLAIIANRVSYFLNLRGPSESIDTACASSLVALHHAVRSIREGACDCAIAGGVNVILDPTLGEIFHNSGVVAADGRCKTFDRQADGYVRGEGVGAVLLKPLEVAMSDGDHIYGIIKGSAVNHGGRANSLMAPNANAQAEVIVSAFEDACVDPRAVGLVETHGTGTKLGDPVEINGLKTAFKTLYGRQGQTLPATPHCALGSVKTYIGHLEAAAGIAGVIRVLLALKSRRLVRNLHFENLNPYIELQESPFYLPEKSGAWELPMDAAGNPMCRIAGVSAFGFGGTNAHVVIAEPPESGGSIQQPIMPASYIIVLSARTKDRLMAYVDAMTAYLEEKAGEGDAAPDDMFMIRLAYTLQVGREGMDERLAIVVDVGSDTVMAQVQGVILKMKAFRSGQTSVEAVYHGRLSEGIRKNRSLQAPEEDAAFETDIEKWIRNGETGRIAAQWVQGAEIQWERFYANAVPGRMSLPAYPFAREKYWVETIDKSSNCETSPVHPFIDRIVCRLPDQGVVFEKKLYRDEAVLLDHRVRSLPIFPAAGYMEMALAAMARINSGKIAVVRDVAFPYPLAVTDEFEILQLTINGSQDCYEWKIRSGRKGSRVLHARGRYCLPDEKYSGNDLIEKPAHKPTGAAVRIREMIAGGRSEAGHTEIYRRFHDAGVTYGPFFQCMQRIWFGDAFAIALLSLPDAATDQCREYVLHPSLIDAALQSVAMFMARDKGEPGMPQVVAGLGAVEILRPLRAEMYACVESAGREQFTVTMTEADGKRCVILRDIAVKPMQSHGMPHIPPRAIRQMTYEPVWRQEKIPEIKGTVSLRKTAPRKVLIVGGMQAGKFMDALAAHHVNDQTVILLPGGMPEKDFPPHVSVHRVEAEAHSGFESCGVLFNSTRFDDIYFLGGFETGDMPTSDPENQYGHSLLVLFRLLKTLIQYRHFEKPLTFRLITVNGHPIDAGLPCAPGEAALHGLMRSAAMEYSELNVACIDVQLKRSRGRNDRSDVALTAALIAAEPGDKAGCQIVLRDGKKYMRAWNPLTLEPAQASPFRENGVYVIIGGMGGIGFVLAMHLAQSAGARLALLGRSNAGPIQAEKCEKLRELGGDAMYIQADVADAVQMRAAVARIKEAFGRIHGVFHSAVDLQDTSLAFMDEMALAASLLPKIRGGIVLHHVLENESIDFLMFFSSVLSFCGNAGQSNYAAGSAFQDAFAEYLDATCAYPVFSINWGFWGSVGRVAAAYYIDRMAAAGIASISPGEGMEILERALHSGQKRLVVFKTLPRGDASETVSIETVSRCLRGNMAAGAVSDSSNAPAAREDTGGNPDNNTGNESSARLKSMATAFVTDVFSRVLRVDARIIKPDVTFDQYGVDSLTGMQIIRTLEKTFDVLPVTLLYENMTIALLADYFIGHHRQTLLEKTGSVPLPGSAPVAEDRPDRLQIECSGPGIGNGVSTGQAPGKDPIAVIGLGGRYPQASNLEEFWGNLKNGVSAISEVPRHRWDWKIFESRSISKWGGFLEDADKFDPLFFNISPREAAMMDPQERLFLETAWAVIEDAGYTRKSLGESGNRVGVFVGVMNSGYAELGIGNRQADSMLPARSFHWSIANRVSYFLDLKGPSIALDTACSSSLTAIHLACESIRRGECEMAIAGGVNLILHPGHFIALSEMNMLTRDNKCKAFGAGADGFVAGEGVGAVLLKRLDPSVTDRDNIHGVIKGSFINAGGKTGGYTVPNPNAQADLIQTALNRSGVDCRAIRYLEAHGTGTTLGDPIEIAALVKAFRAYTSERQFCAVGSVKTNIGHLESAAGIAGLTKVLMQMKYKQCVPSLHALPPNPGIDFESSPFFVQTKTETWEPAVVEIGGRSIKAPLCAGVSSFGAGGANAHMLVEAYEYKQTRPSPVFMFSGVGDHYAGMGKALYEQSPEFRRHIDECCDILKKIADMDFRKYITEFHETAGGVSACGDVGAPSVCHSPLDHPVISHPIFSHSVMFMVEYAVSKLLMTKGLRPAAMIGESLGEYVAACISGVMTLEEALRMVFERSRFIGNSPEGAMSVVLQSETELAPFCSERLFIAVVNAPHICVVSGYTEAVADLEAEMKTQGIAFRRLPIRHAFHSPLLACISDDYKAVLREIDFKAPRIPYVSNVTGRWITPADAMDPDYWVRQTCGTVRLADGFRELLQEPNRLFVEIGPGRSLNSFLLQAADDPSLYENRVFQTLPEEKEARDGGLFWAESFKKLSARVNNFNSPQVIVLSARDRDRLKTRARELHAYLLERLDFVSEARAESAERQTDALPDRVGATMQDVAYTLQTGREAMKERLALVVSELDELLEKLKQFAGGKKDISGLYTGNAHARETAVDLLFEGDAGQQFISGIIRSGELEKIARLWAAGADIDWRLLYEGTSPRRISLPTYPFARERCWLPASPTFRPGSPAKKENSGAERQDNDTVSAVPGDRREGAVRERAVAYVKHQIATVTGVDADRLSAADDFETYGIDSVMIGKLNAIFEKQFGALPSTLLFSYKTIAALADYFANHHRIRFEALDHEKTMITDAVTGCDPGEPDASDAPRIQATIHPCASDFRKAVGDATQNDIAITGLSGIYPMAENTAVFWENLKAGRDCIVEIPEDRWNWRAFFDTEKGRTGKMYTRWGGFISDVDAFDAGFFGIAPHTAQSMDPQERLFLQTAWACLEDAGYTPEVLADPDDPDRRADVGVFAGVTFNEYALHGGEAWGRGNALPVSTQIFSVANRVSHAFNFRGPSLSVDTACSSSLYALYLAVESIRRGECGAAIAGGVNLTLHPNKYVLSSAYRFASSDGKCRSFGDGGDGYVAGEGVGAVLLKPLSTAIKDNDHIYAVIKGAAVNHDGRTNGYTVPNPVAQAAVIRMALEKAKVHPETISYVEAHGTGTALGDPIEMTALSDAFGAFTDRTGFCRIGSVKSNIGHLESAAGIAQLTKVVLQLQHKTLVPSLIHSRKLNANIRFEETPFVVQQQLEPWIPVLKQESSRDGAGPLRAGISSFGAGGVNVHMIVEEYVESSLADAMPETAEPVKTDAVIVLSAENEASLYASVEKLHDFLDGRQEDGRFNLRNMAYTLQTGRQAMAFRVAFVVDSLPGLSAALAYYTVHRTPHQVSELHGFRIYQGRGDQKAAVRESEATGTAVCPPAAEPQELAEQWVDGRYIDWVRLYAGESPGRVSLPTYAFRKTRYWYPVPNAHTGPAEVKRRDEPGNPAPREENAAAGMDTSEISSIRETVSRRPAGEQLEVILHWLQRLVGTVLGFSKGDLPNPEKGFFDMGMESVQANRLVDMMERALNLTLYPTVIFDYPNIADLGQYLLEMIQDACAQSGADAVFGTAKDDAPIDIFYLRPVWVPEAARQETPILTDNGPLLLVDPDASFFNILNPTEANATRSGYRDIALAFAGKDYEKPEDRIYKINPLATDHIGRMLDDLEQTKFIPDTVMFMAPEETWDTDPEVLDRQLQNSLFRVFYFVKTLIARGYRHSIRIAYCFFGNPEKRQPLYSALSGFSRSVRREARNIFIKTIEIDGAAGMAAGKYSGWLKRVLITELNCGEQAGDAIRYEKKNRFRRYLEQIPAPPDINSHEKRCNADLLRQKGVYLITGGLGGVGLVVAEYLARTVEGRLILTGRSDLDAHGKKRIAELQSFGAEVVYMQADVSRRPDVEKLLAKTGSVFQSLNGIIHSAGVVNDAYIINKRGNDMQSVLLPKVHGTVCIDSVCRRVDLDFFILFSSVVAETGNIGQCDYAYANQFLNDFARWRNHMQARQQRRGLCISINWPVWRNGGMQMDAGIQKYMRDVFGLAPLENTEGVAAFETALGLRSPQLILLKGQTGKINRLLHSYIQEEKEKEEKETAAVEMSS